MNLRSLFFNTLNVISKTTLENSYSFKFKQSGIRTWVQVCVSNNAETLNHILVDRPACYESQYLLPCRKN